MKKFVSVLAVIAALFCISASYYAGDITVTVNEDKLNLDQSPVIVDGRTLVPFRGIFEAFGADVSWDGTDKTVTGTLGNDSIVLTIGNNSAIVNGKTKKLDVPPQIINDYTMVPVRFVSESLGANVQWDANTRTVKIRHNNFTIVFADVGQGDCQLIMCNGKTMLIDGGTADKSSTVVAILNKYGVEYIDYVVATHAHADHCGGLAGALHNFKAGTVIVPDTVSDSDAYSEFISAAKAQGSSIINPQPGYTFDFGKGQVIILGPVNESSSELNDTSIVLKIIYGNKSFMFTGDCEYKGEMDILETGADLSADVLKVGHHGAETSSSYLFLREVMPEYAVISVGKDNSYGHPTNETLSRLRDVGAEVFRTDIQGDIIIKSDGNNIDITTFKNQNMQTNPTESSLAQESVYIGNARSKKLHKADCTGLPNENNREYFSSRSEAINKNYVPCKICNP